MAESTVHTVISPHPAPVIELDETAAPAPTRAPSDGAVKQEAPTCPIRDTVNSSEIFCGAVPPLPAGWCQPDLSGSFPPLPKPDAPLISVAELATSLGIALVSGLAFGGLVAYLLSKPKTACGQVTS